MPRSVAVILEDDYSMQLESVAFHTPVWMLDTPANRTAAEQVWRTAVEWPHISVTLFRETDWSSLLHQIALHERHDALDVIGAPLTDAARVALDEAGFVRIEETQSGFRARR